MYSSKHKSAVMFSSAAVLLMALGGNSAYAAHVNCVSADSDPDGDGWGWENNHSCVVVDNGNSGECKGKPYCSSSQSDPDGDGWGYENNKSCMVKNSSVDTCSTTTPPTNPDGEYPICYDDVRLCELGDGVSDSSGKGWGWDSNANDGNGHNCIVVDSKAHTQKCPNVSIDGGSTGTGTGTGTGTVLETPTRVEDPNQSDRRPRQEQFYMFQAGDLVFNPNVYSGSGTTIWRGESVSSDLCEADTSANTLTGNVTFKYNLSQYSSYGVKAFPAAVLGTMGGRDATYNIPYVDKAECGTEAKRVYLDSDQQEVSSDSSRRANTASMLGILDMGPATAATSFPNFASEIKDLDAKIAVKGNIHHSNGVANLFLDTYWHDVDDNVFDGTRKVADSALVGKINGINENKTEVWNLNVWFDKPTITTHSSNPPGYRSDNGWTGGDLLGTTDSLGGKTYDVYFKKEIEGEADRFKDCRLGHVLNDRGNPANCFLYVGLVLRDTDPVNNRIEINYKDIARWFMSDKFKNLILDGAQVSDDDYDDLKELRDDSGTNLSSSQSIKLAKREAYDIWKASDGTSNDSDSITEKRGPRFPDDDHVVGGLHLGSEIWGNRNGAAALITFDKLGFKVGNRTFGIFD